MVADKRNNEDRENQPSYRRYDTARHLKPARTSSGGKRRREARLRQQAS